jgi:hypothetical protein
MIRGYLGRLGCLIYKINKWVGFADIENLILGMYEFGELITVSLSGIKSDREESLTISFSHLQSYP